MSDADGFARGRGLTAPDRSGLKMAILTARFLTHVFLVFGFFGLMIGLGDNGSGGAWVALITVGGFLFCYFGWVALVLFGYMNFSLSVMLGFVLALGACIGLLMSGEVPLMVAGGAGLFVLIFATVLPVSKYDPTTERRESGERKPGPVMMLIVPFLCIGALCTGEPVLVLLAIVGLGTFAVVAVFHDRPRDWREWGRGG